MADVALKPVLCRCCGEPIQYETKFDLKKEPMVGFVCEECKRNLSMAVGYLEQFKMHGCEDFEERSPMS
jgi:hypothetical protein